MNPTHPRRGLRNWCVAVTVALVVMFLITGAAVVLVDQVRGGPASRSAIHHIDSADDFTHARAIRSDCITNVNQRFYYALTNVVVYGLAHPGRQIPMVVSDPLGRSKADQLAILRGTKCKAPQP